MLRFLIYFFVFWSIFAFEFVSTRLEPGILERQVVFDSEAEIVAFQRSAFKNTKLEIKFSCDEKIAGSYEIEVAVRSSPCLREFYEVLGNSEQNLGNFSAAENLQFYFEQERRVIAGFDYDSFYFYRTKRPISVQCIGHYVYLTDVFDQRLAKIDKAQTLKPERVRRDLLDSKPTSNSSRSLDHVESNLKTGHAAFILPEDGIYLVIVKIYGQFSKGGDNTKSKPINNISILIDWKHQYGYLSPIDWPLLSFYGLSCIIYLIYAIIWTVFSFLHWKDLLRVQYWIGGVIVLGMLEKAAFYFEYQTTNHTGREMEGAIEFAEIMSCLKKTLSIIMVIIVSVGFGVVKPRLGSTLNKVLCIGFAYFVLCAIEGLARVSKVQHDSPRQKQIVALPLVLLQLGSFYWIFSALLDTMRGLRLRRNEVKLNLYRRFTHTLIVCVFCSVIFMLWSLIRHQMNLCLKDWQNLWLDIAVWHVLFSVILLVIIILWRPSQNNQRYAFSPLLDNADDDDEDELLNTDAFTGDLMKIRMNNTTKAESRKSRDQTRSFEDDLKWVEEHIPASFADKTLPALVDEDEDLRKTKFEISKMQ